jgi:hypothetical protein
MSSMLLRSSSLQPTNCTRSFQAARTVTQVRTVTVTARGAAPTLIQNGGSMFCPENSENPP